MTNVRTSFCVNGRCPPRIDERAYLGTDKSVPYIDRAYAGRTTEIWIFPRTNPRKSA
ncbi:MAG: hypothetical protein FWG87_06365 [Defluviitaleaceae bacterium]|nr:hypothetical protein [Defluviitaleaceae bacterium]